MLQSVISAHPAVWSFPESRLFRSIESQQPFLRKRGIASHHAVARLGNIVRELGLDAERVRRRLKVDSYARDLFRRFDQAATTQACTAWLEKTPDHVHAAQQIRTLLPDARFIHLIRGGEETVASLVDVTRRYPEAWGGAPWSVDQCLTRWCEDVNESLMWQKTAGHLLVSYEQFVADPITETANIFKFLGLSSEVDLTERGVVSAEQIVLPSELWKAASGGEVKAGKGKFTTLFSVEEQAFVRSGISEFSRALAEVFGSD